MIYSLTLSVFVFKAQPPAAGLSDRQLFPRRKTVTFPTQECLRGPKQLLTFSAVNLQVRGGQVVVHVMLVDFFKEALSLPQLQVLSRVAVPDPLRVVRLR